MTIGRLLWLSLSVLGVVLSHTHVFAQPSSGTLMSKLGPERRTALLIGNSAYQVPEMALENPVNDVRLMSKVLTAAGFEVMVVEDASRRQMHDAVEAFGKKLKLNKGVGLFFYAGHGMQVKGVNYLIPTDVQAGRESSATFDSLNVGTLVDAMADANNTTNIIILDACRNDPFAGTRSGATGTGLAQMSVPAGSYVVYAAGVGQTASDGSAGNGLFTQHFARSVQEGMGRSISDVMMQVRTNVRRDSKGAQTPWDLNALETNFYFYAQGATPSVVVTLPAIVPAAPPSPPAPPSPAPLPPLSLPPPAPLPPQPLPAPATQPPEKPLLVAIVPPSAPPKQEPKPEAMQSMWRFNEQNQLGSIAPRVLQIIGAQDGWQRMSDGSQHHTDGRVKAWRIGNVLLQGASEDGLWRFPLKAGALVPLTAELVKPDGKTVPARLFISAEVQQNGQMQLTIKADAITELLQYSAVFKSGEAVPISYQAEMKNRLTGALALKLTGQRSE